MSKSSTSSPESEWAEFVIPEEMLVAGVQMMDETTGLSQVEQVAYIYAAMEGVRRLLAEPVSATAH